jgi:hypothetical protein
LEEQSIAQSEDAISRIHSISYAELFKAWVPFPVWELPAAIGDTASMNWLIIQQYYQVAKGDRIHTFYRSGF